MHDIAVWEEKGTGGKIFLKKGFSPGAFSPYKDVRMNIKVQMGMVLNLDKCLACHTCSIPCKNAWTTAPGTEYMWFNNVETKPGVGYPKEWENQDRYKGGWEIRDGKLHLRAGGKTDKIGRASCRERV